MEFVFVFVVFLLAMGGFILSLHFSKYKQSDSGCCGGGNCESGNSGGGGSCYSDKMKFVDEYSSDN
jgi:hypothetical protein